MDDPTATRSLNVTEQLREMLLQGELPPDTRLQEVTLAERMAVSRTPVREALRVLAKDGLLIYSPNRGYVVRRFTAEDILKAFRVRGVLEGLGSRMAAEQGLDDQQLAMFEHCLAQSEALLGQDLSREENYSRWRDLNKQFHVAILMAAGNELLVRCAETSRTIPIVFNGSFKWYQFEDFRRSHDHHKLIFHAIRKGQGERADRLMQEHIYTASEILKEHFERNDVYALES